MATIKVRENGPLLIEGDDVTVIDWNGNAYPIEKRPFCDLTHRGLAFKAGEAAPPKP